MRVKTSYVGCFEKFTIWEGMPILPRRDFGRRFSPLRIFQHATKFRGM